MAQKALRTDQSFLHTAYSRRQKSDETSTRVRTPKGRSIFERAVGARRIIEPRPADSDGSGLARSKLLPVGQAAAARATGRKEEGAGRREDEADMAAEDEGAGETLGVGIDWAGLLAHETAGLEHGQA